MDEELDEFGFKKSELIDYDKYAKFYHSNIINSLILFTYNSDELDKMTPILIDPLTELYEDIEYAFTPVCFETVFRNNSIDTQYKEELIQFKIQVDEIPNEIWAWEFLDDHQTWKSIRAKSNDILNTLGINHRKYNDEYTTILNSGEIIKKDKS